MKVTRYRLITAAFSLAVVMSALSARPVSAAPVTRQVANYVPPSANLIDSTGRAVALDALLKSHRAVVLEFIFTSCSTICGLQTSALAVARPKLGPDVAILSISIDPEFDTPRRLHDFGKNFGVGANWRMLTGRRQDIAKILTAFDARPYGDDKMLHRPLVFIRPGAGSQWVRLEGLMNGDQLAAEFRNAVIHRSSPSTAQAGFLENLLGLFQQ